MTDLRVKFSLSKDERKQAMIQCGKELSNIEGQSVSYIILDLA